MSGFGPERSNVCAVIGAPHSGHARSARSATAAGESSRTGPTAAGPARRMSFAFSQAYQPPASLATRVAQRRGGIGIRIHRVMIISVLKIRAR